MFSKLLCIVNIRCYKIEQLKVHQSLLGVKGGGGVGGQKQPSEQPSPQHSTVMLKYNIFFYQILVKSAPNSTNTLGKCTYKYNKYIAHFFSKISGGGEPKIIPWGPQ